ncbi:hypothetical protein LOAG_18064 [Loa loa]|uniref:Uncharacterized protein n=1 Tax=Loa loa TaxID=7209 RepID=A0A1S0UGR8_LOALO|nr:hypothetical protein LOAG_18064 [Loa loa]EJD74641.1 hypothetical protein LOAG_18064 [Loa loa]
MRGYDIAPENYDVIMDVLLEKYGDPFTIIKLLYNVLHSIKKITIERVLRQLEALRVSLEYSSVKIALGSRLPRWILKRKVNYLGLTLKAVKIKRSLTLNENKWFLTFETSVLPVINQPELNRTGRTSKSSKKTENKIEKILHFL